MTATRGTDLGTLTIGAWTARPRTGTAEVDPYSRASIARSGELPVGTGDGAAFSATTDDRKRPLDGRCDVVVSGVTPAARFWTLTLYDSKGHLVANSLQRYGFSSQGRGRSATRRCPRLRLRGAHDPLAVHDHRGRAAGWRRASGQRSGVTAHRHPGRLFAPDADDKAQRGYPPLPGGSEQR